MTLICAPRVEEMETDMARAKSLGADLVVIRLDFLRHFRPDADLPLLISNRTLPGLITYRHGRGKALILLTMFGYLCLMKGVVAAQQVPAVFASGDSLIDDENNNGLNSVAKSNYYPYGIDFKQGATGRFCNGKTIVDALCDLPEVPYIPAYTSGLNGTRLHTSEFGSNSSPVQAPYVNCYILEVYPSHNGQDATK